LKLHDNIPHQDNDLQSVWLKAKSSLRQSILICCIFSFALNILQLGLPLFSMQIFDRVLPTGQIPTLFALATILLALLCISGLIDLSRTQLLYRIAYRVSLQLNEAVCHWTFLSGIQSQPLSDVENIRLFLAGPSATALIDAPASMLFLAAIYSIHPILGVFALFSVGVLAVVTILGDYSSKDDWADYHRLATRVGEIVESGLRDKQALTGLGILPTLRTRLATERRALLEAHEIGSHKKTVFETSSRTLRSLLQVGILTIAAYLAVKHEINYGAIIASSMLFTRCSAACERISSSIDGLIHFIHSLREMDQIVEKADSGARKLVLPPLKGIVSLENVTVGHPYSSAPILQDISLVIKPGLVYVVVGPEGAGKSTLAKLLCGTVTPGRGFVRFDGMAIQNFDDEQISSQIGYLPESLMIRRGTIASFISREGAVCDQAVIEAASLAQVDDLIKSLPSGYQTELGGSIPMLSMGQLKRLSLARAVYRKPRLLILDEPMSNLDEDGQNCVLSMIDTFRKRSTSVFVISSSIRLLNAADELLLIEEGKIRLRAEGANIRRFSVSGQEAAV
jgi:ATP-binding cassette subfamily C protein EexD